MSMTYALKWIAIGVLMLRLEALAWQHTTDSKLPKIVGGSAEQKVAKPALPMEKLIRALAGEWSTQETYEPSDLVPKGGVGHSRDSYRVGPARASLIEEYHSEGAAGKSWGIGIIWWDDKSQEFRDAWCDSFALDQGCRMSSEGAKWEGDSFVGTDEHEVSGKRVFEKEVWSNFTPNSFTHPIRWRYAR
jgi:hypothetical protein